MIKQRLLSAVGGLLILIAASWAGSLPFFVFMTVVLVLAVREFRPFLLRPMSLDFLLLPLLSVLFFFSIYLQSWIRVEANQLQTNQLISSLSLDLSWLQPYLNFKTGFLQSGLTAELISVINLPVLVLLAAVLILVLAHIKEHSYNYILIRISSRIFMILYLAGGLSFLFLLRDFGQEGFHNTRALWLVLAATWLTDTGAYFSGNWFGSRPMAPVISPKKTIAGGIGGVLFSVFAVSVYLLLLGNFSPRWLLLAPLISLAAVVGDLFESCLKRDADIKDSGEILPGHGGILDRFDSLLFSAPLTYYILVFLI